MRNWKSFLYKKIKRSLKNMSHNAEEVCILNWKTTVSLSWLINKFCHKYYTLALMTFVNDAEIEDHFFCNEELTEISRGRDIFKVLSLHLKIQFGPERTILTSTLVMLHQWLFPWECLPLLYRSFFKKETNALQILCFS